MSVEFDPVRLGQRRRGVEPAVIGVVVMAVAIVVAVAKPWEPSQAPSGPTAGPAIAAAGPSSSSRAATTPRPTASPPDWVDVTSAVTEHDAWGVSAILMVRRASSGIPVSPPDPRYVERWAPVTGDASGADAVARVDRQDRPIAALGVTAPGGTHALAVRIWRVHDQGELEWVDTTRIDDLVSTTAPVLVQLPLVDGITATPWESGQYRIDMLTGSGIQRISVVIPDRFGNVPRPDAWAAAATGVVAARASNPSVIRIGLFATVNGSAVPIAARRSELLGETEAWIDVAFAGGTTVPVRHLPHATGLGVMLTQHAFVESATIQRLAPGPLVDAPEPFGGISDVHGSTPFVIFEAPADGVWAPGVYALTVEWRDTTGTHLETWHVELRPGLG